MPNLAVASPHRPLAAHERLLCLHSSAGSGRQWEPIAAVLSRRFEVLAPDLLGYGPGARWSTGTPVSLDAEAQALAPLLQRGGVHLFGHSYGGAVALQIALRWPERIRSLTLFEPVRFALLRDAAAREAHEQIVSVGRRIGMDVLSLRAAAAAQRFVDYWSGDGGWARLEPRQQQALAARMPKVQAEFEALFADRVPASAYAELTMPVQLLGGSRSPLPARQALQLLAQHLPRASSIVLPGLGHMAPVEAPVRVLGALEHLGTVALPQAA